MRRVTASGGSRLTSTHTRTPSPQLAIIDAPRRIFGDARVPFGRMLRGVELRALSAAELARAGSGGRWLRRERRRRARALLLGALELRWALLQAFPACHSSLWLYGLPLGHGIARGGSHVARVRARAFRRNW